MPFSRNLFLPVKKMLKQTNKLQNYTSSSLIGCKTGTAHKRTLNSSSFVCLVLSFPPLSSPPLWYLVTTRGNSGQLGSTRGNSGQLGATRGNLWQVVTTLQQLKKVSKPQKGQVSRYSWFFILSHTCLETWQRWKLPIKVIWDYEVSSLHAGPPWLRYFRQGTRQDGRRE